MLTRTMDDVKLIELVSHHPEIYDVNHEKHSDIKYKQGIWMRISEGLHLPPETEKGEEAWKFCKNRWTNIRDQLTKCRRHRKISKKRIKPYKYEHLLTFLQAPPDEDLIGSVKHELFHAHHAANTSEEQGDQIDPLDDSSFLGNTLYRYQPKTATITNTTKENEAEENGEVGKNVHEIDAFLSGISSTLKKLPPFLQHVAKGRIFSVIHDMEAQYYSSSTHPNVPT